MKIRPVTFFCVLLWLTVISASAQNKYDPPVWTIGTAQTMERKTLEVSVFQYTRYGITNRLEAFAHPLGFILMPNAGVKYQWMSKPVLLASRHILNFPTLSLSTVRNTGMSYPSFFSPPPHVAQVFGEDNTIPFMTGFTNEVLASKWLKKENGCQAQNYLLTGRLGIQFAAGSKKSSLDTVYAPVLFPRTSIHQGDVLWYIGADLEAWYSETLAWRVDIDFLSVNLFDFWALEHKGMLVFSPEARKVKIVGGYKAAFSTMPDRGRILLMPYADLIWTFDLNRRGSGGEVTGSNKNPKRRKAPY